jgi:hypothetical protein
MFNAVKVWLLTLKKTSLFLSNRSNHLRTPTLSCPHCTPPLCSQKHGVFPLLCLLKIITDLFSFFQTNLYGATLYKHKR